jgi:chemotaxis protein methyltransferase WspC
MSVSPAIRTILQRSIGLAPESLGDRMIQTAIDRRMAALKLTSLTDYEFRLATDAQEVQVLADAVVVHETWFYRYPASFNLLAQVVSERVKNGERVRILSVPCSTGEEPYSIVMTLLDANIPPTAFEVLGIDLSKTALAEAEVGVYRDLSFREKESPHNPSHFTAVPNGRAISAAVKRLVTFRHGNLADPFFLANSPRFGVIFCRNLFIYLTTETRHRVVGTLTRLLEPDGMLFLGHADTGVLADIGYRSFGAATAFAYRRVAAQTRPSESIHQPAVLAQEGVILSARGERTEGEQRPGFEPGIFSTLKGSKGEIATDRTPHLEGAEHDPTNLLAAAQRAADAGDWATAAGLCDQMVANRTADADTFALLGAVRSAAGDPAGATRELEKALFLNPKHYDALLGLLALAERRGDQAAIANYRRRVRAVEALR